MTKIRLRQGQDCFFVCFLTGVLTRIQSLTGQSHICEEKFNLLPIKKW